MADEKESCVKPSKGLLTAVETQTTQNTPETKKEGIKMLARVGKPAPDFELSAYIDGGFKNIRLSDFKGKWIVLCFYPGDFTFV